jgi:hypothetical protein
MTERLKSRSYSNSEISSRSSSTIPPSSTLTNNSLRQDTDTIQKNSLEHFPESLSGKPLISNGLNVTDMLSLHNAQVRLAQEMMTKANHLLETSKDFFVKPPTIEQEFTASPSMLANFNTTNEFQTTDHSLKQQHSIIWSDEDDEHNQNLLPINHLPIPRRSVSSSFHLEDNSTYREEQNDVDIVHIHPLNNLSAFNFDRQQMNSERINGKIQLSIFYQFEFVF